MQTYEDFGKGINFFVHDCLKTKKRAVYQFHMHPQYELLIVPHSVVTATVLNGTTVETDTPIAVLTAPFCGHFSYYLDNVKPETKHYGFYFDEEFLNRFGDNVLPIREMLKGKSATILDLSGRVEPIMHVLRGIFSYRKTEQLLEKKSESESGSSLGRELLVISLFHMLNDLCSAESRQSVKIGRQSYIVDVMGYIVQHPDGDLRVATLAEKFFVSRDKLCRDFQGTMQMTVGEFVVLVRLNLAKNLLLEKKLSNKEISYRVGFENDVYFYSFFKKHMGITPKEFARGREAQVDNLHKMRAEEL